MKSSPRRIGFKSQTTASLATIAAAASLVALVMLGLPGTAALFTSDYPKSVTISTSHIFRGERVSPAFSVHDRSGGTAVDVSNPIAYVGDGPVTTTANWSMSFDLDRYIEIRLNSSLPAGIALSSAWFELTWSSPGASACLYFTVSDASGTLIESHGNAQSPVACASGTAPIDTTVPLSAVAITDDANAARIRLFVADPTAGTMIIDAARLRVGYSGDTFRLYAVDLIDAADTTPALRHWGLAGP